MKNEEAELSILGAILLDQSCMDQLSYIHPAHFTTDARANIFKVMQEIHANGDTIDGITIRSIDNTIKRDMINFLIDYVPTAVNAWKYANLVADCAKRRDLIDAIDKARSLASDTKDVKEAIDNAEASILAVRTVDHAKDGVSVQQALKIAYKDIQERYEKNGEIIGLETGFADLDNMTTGLQGGDLVLLAARPSMGKTAFAVNIAENVCRNGKSVQIFSLEMSASQLIQRGLSSVANVNAQSMRTGDFKPADWGRMSTANEVIFKWNMRIEDGFSQTLLDIRSAARRQSRTKQGLDFIIIDYLQLINTHGKHQNREQEVANMSRSLKQLAKELNVPIMVLAQLNRDLETRPDKRPKNSDLRESGSLEQDADLIIFLHRETYFCPKCRDAKLVCDENHLNSAEAIISKQRNGPTGTIKLSWMGELCKFYSVSNAKQGGKLENGRQ